MIKQPLVFGFFLCLLSGAFLYGQEEAEASMEEILREALSMNIHAKVSQDIQNIMWESEVEKLTIPGRPLTVHLKNRRARLSVHFTPYRNGEGGLLLVAQSEIWLVQTTDEDTRPEGIRYYSSVKSIPLEYGEEVLFFPLGKMDSLNNPEKLHIEMAVMITPYDERGVLPEEALSEGEGDSGDEAGN